MTMLAISVAALTVLPAHGVDARMKGATSISFVGTCLFGTGSGAGFTEITMDPSGVTIAGDGSCQGNAGPDIATLQLHGSGPFACNRGTGRMDGSLFFDPQPPDSKANVTATVIIGLSSAHLVITDVNGDLYASADFAWTGTSGLSGCVTTSLDGSLIYVDS